MTDSLSSVDFDTLPGIINTSFKHHCDTGFITCYTVDHAHSITSNGVTHTLNVVPELKNKPGARPTTPDLSSPPEKDSFNPSNFQEGDLITCLGQEYNLLNNAYAIAQNHIMLVPAQFRPQSGRLLPLDLWTTYRILKSSRQQKSGMWAFFNGGFRSGASQPHLHVQFVPEGEHTKPTIESYVAGQMKDIPIGVLSELGVPWTQYTIKISDSPDQAELFTAYSILLAKFEAFLAQLPARDMPPVAKRESYNLMMTSEHMHLIPRRERISKTRGFELPINTLAYAGVWLVMDDETAKSLEDGGVDQALVHCGYPSSRQS